MCIRVAVATTIATLAALAAALDYQNGYGTGKAISITKNSSFVNADSSVDFDALKLHVASVRAKILHGLDNYQNNTGTAYPDAVGGARKHGAGDSLTDYRDVLWYGNILVGTPPKMFTVCFDTGSSDLFLPGVNCDISCDGHQLWDPTSSSTAKDLDLQFLLRYGDGSTVSGEQYRDTVSISGFTATKQTLGVATTYSSQFGPSIFPADGLLGMAFRSISSFNSSPLFETLVSEKKVPKAQFSFKLSSKGGELFVGGSNPELYKGNFSYAHVTHKGYWQVTMENLKDNGKTLLKHVDTIIDTGTSIIIGEASQVSTMYKALGGNPVPGDGNQGFYSFPCNKFPNISLTFGNKSFPIPFSDLNLGKVSNRSEDCVSGIAGLNIGFPFWIIGDVFLRNVYTMFDLKHSVVGFAELA